MVRVHSGKFTWRMVVNVIFRLHLKLLKNVLSFVDALLASTYTYLVFALKFIQLIPVIGYLITK